MHHALTRITIGAGLIAGTAAILLGDVAVAWWADRNIAPGFWLLLGAALLAGGWEFVRMLRRAGHPVRPVIAAVFVVLLVACAWVEIHAPGDILPWLHTRGLELYLLLIIALIFTTFLAEIIRVERGDGDMGRALASVGWTTLVVLTTGLLGVFLAKVRFLSAVPTEGLLYLALTLGVVKAADIGAYAVGSTLGRHRLVPKLSPKKTVEGLAGALAAGIAVAFLIGVGWGRFGWVQMLIFGTAVSTSGILGDLAESLIKRACGVKDSGHIPAFGGALDVLDSMLAAAPVAYLVLVVLTGPVRMG
jgi:phosphatidate cytidylyltransferase